MFIFSKQVLLVFFLLFLFGHSLTAFSELKIIKNSSTTVDTDKLKNLLLQDCGSCHGMTLKGGIGPALTKDVLKNKSRKMIKMTILNGRSGTPMPPWKLILSQQEVDWLVETLYSGVIQ